MKDNVNVLISESVATTVLQRASLVVGRQAAKTSSMFKLMYT